jgi:hypothetical protein
MLNGIFEGRRVEYFNLVRDIPYRIPTKFAEKNYSCAGKHKMLKELFEKIGLNVRPRICETKWSLIKQIPKNILKISHDDETLHLYLEAFIDDEFKTIDASLESKLENVFEINKWDGKSDTLICFPPTKIYSPEKSLGIFNSKINEKDYLERLENNYEFYTEFNSWLDTIRKNYSKNSIPNSSSIS